MISPLLSRISKHLKKRRGEGDREEEKRQREKIIKHTRLRLRLNPK
jgi:hypothetical protein